MVPGGLALFPPQAEGNARKEAASYQAEETISKPQPPLWLNHGLDGSGRGARNTCEASIAGVLS